MELTATQAAFVFVATSAALQLALCGRAAGGMGPIGPWCGAATAAVACWLGLALGGGVGLLLFPDYPDVGPPEKVGLLFVTPALALGTSVVVALLKATRPLAFEKPPPADFHASLAAARRLLASTLVVLGVGPVALYACFTSREQRALPWTATEVRDPFRRGLLFDTTGLVSARMSEGDAHDYVARFELIVVPPGGWPPPQFSVPRGTLSWRGEAGAAVYQDGRLEVHLWPPAPGNTDGPFR